MPCHLVIAPTRAAGASVKRRIRVRIWVASLARSPTAARAWALAAGQVELTAARLG